MKKNVLSLLISIILILDTTLNAFCIPYIFDENKINYKVNNLYKFITNIYRYNSYPKEQTINFCNDLLKLIRDFDSMLYYPPYDELPRISIKSMYELSKKYKFCNIIHLINVLNIFFELEFIAFNEEIESMESTLLSFQTQLLYYGFKNRGKNMDECNYYKIYNYDERIILVCKRCLKRLQANYK